MVPDSLKLVYTIDLFGLPIKEYGQNPSLVFSLFDLKGKFKIKNSRIFIAGDGMCDLKGNIRCKPSQFYYLTKLIYIRQQETRSLVVFRNQK